MKTEINNKKEYVTPVVEMIKLDKEISLQLQSVPPTGPGELSQAPEYFNNEPYQMG